MRTGLALVSGRIAAEGGADTAAGMTKEVAFELVSGPINDHIDEAYQGAIRRPLLTVRSSCLRNHGQRFVG